MEKEGQQKIQHVVDESHIVLPNTNPKGKDIVREQTQKLQANWDALLSGVTESCSLMQNTISQWQVMDDMSNKLEKWLTETKQSLENCVPLLATLPEKRNRLDKIKV